MGNPYIYTFTVNTGDNTEYWWVLGYLNPIIRICSLSQTHFQRTTGHYYLFWMDVCLNRVPIRRAGKGNGMKWRGLCWDGRLREFSTIQLLDFFPIRIFFIWKLPTLTDKSIVFLWRYHIAITFRLYILKSGRKIFFIGSDKSLHTSNCLRIVNLFHR